MTLTLPEPPASIGGGRLLDLGRMARHLRVASSWLADEARAGRVPAVAAGRSFLFDAELVERVLLERARTINPTPEAAAV